MTWKLSEYRRYRLLEMIPGFLTWTTFVFAIAFSFLNPLGVIYFIIVYDFLWLVRVLYLQIYLLVSYRRFRAVAKIDWLSRAKTLSRFSHIYHLIFLPTYQEEIEVLRTTFESLRQTHYPTDRMIVVLATEERDKDRARENIRLINEEFRGIFFKIIVTEHPKDLFGEVAGKGSNLNWAGHRVKEWIDREGIGYEDVIVSSFDIDTCVHPEYFGYLTHTYLTHPNPTRTSYQPVALFNNNIWDAPPFMRIVANGTTFWLLTELARPERLFTFSSHSMSFRALADVDFWQNDIVTEDSRIFLQCFLHYDGDYTMTPLYLPVSMDAVLGKNLWESLKNQYKQQRRWAWGVEHLPYMLWFFWKDSKIPFGKRLHYLWTLGEGMYSWATAPILIFLLGRLPLLVASTQEKSTALAQAAPFVLEGLMKAAMIGLLIMAVLSTFFLPPRPKGIHKVKFFEMILQWFLFPATMILFGSIPATEAQTRLMLGKYLGFTVTEKVRREGSGDTPG